MNPQSKLFYWIFNGMRFYVLLISSCNQIEPNCYLLLIFNRNLGRCNKNFLFLNEGHDAFLLEIDTPQLMDEPCSANLVLSRFCSLHDTAP